MIKIYQFFLLGMIAFGITKGTSYAQSTDSLAVLPGKDFIAQADDPLDHFLGANITYILYARPGGALGSQLRNFWNAVKAQHLNDPPVLEYPPHVTLTGFFPVDDPGNQTQEDALIEALKTAITNASQPIPVTIGSKITQTKNLDYIPITSPALHSIAVDFLELAGIEATFIRPKPGSKLGYHISLRQDTDNTTTKKVRKLESDKINLVAPHLQQNTTWSLYIYRKTGNQLEIIYQQKIIPPPS